MTHNQFKRWLEQREVVVKNGKKHYKVYYNGKRSTLPRHGSQEISEKLRKEVLKQLGLN